MKFNFLLFIIFIIHTNIFLGQTTFEPVVKCYTNNDILNRFENQDQKKLELHACFYTKANKFDKDSVILEIDINSLPTGYSIEDFIIEWKVEGVGFFEDKKLIFKPIDPGGYFVNLILTSKDNLYIGKRNCKLKFSAIIVYFVYQLNYHRLLFLYRTPFLNLFQ